MFAAGRSSAPDASALNAASSSLPCFLFQCCSANSRHAEAIPSFGFDASAAQLPVVPNLEPIKDTAASRLASTLDSRVSDDSGACFSLLVFYFERLTRIQNPHAPDGNGPSDLIRIPLAPTVHPDQTITKQRCLYAAAVSPACMSYWAPMCPQMHTPCMSFHSQRLHQVLTDIICSAFDCIGDSSALLYRKTDPRFKIPERELVLFLTETVLQGRTCIQAMAIEQQGRTCNSCKYSSSRKF